MSEEPCAGCAALKDARDAYVRFGEAYDRMADADDGTPQFDPEGDLVQQWVNGATDAANALGRLLAFYTQPNDRHLHLVKQEDA